MFGLIQLKISLVPSTQQTSTSIPVPVSVVPVQVPVRNLQVQVPVQVLCINYRHLVTLQLHKLKVVVQKYEQLEHR